MSFDALFVFVQFSFVYTYLHDFQRATYTPKDPMYWTVTCKDGTLSKRFSWQSSSDCCSSFIFRLFNEKGILA